MVGTHFCVKLRYRLRNVVQKLNCPTFCVHCSGLRKSRHLLRLRPRVGTLKGCSCCKWPRLDMCGCLFGLGSIVKPIFLVALVWAILAQVAYKHSVELDSLQLECLLTCRQENCTIFLISHCHLWLLKL